MKNKINSLFAFGDSKWPFYSFILIASILGSFCRLQYQGSKNNEENIINKSIVEVPKNIPVGIGNTVKFLSCRMQNISPDSAQNGKKVSAILSNRSYKKYCLQVRKNWKKYNNKHLAKLRAFSKTHVQNYDNSQKYENESNGSSEKKSLFYEKVFYPFSGPDASHPISLFPQAKQYYFFGLEPVGDIPTVNWKNAKNEVRKLWPLYNAVADVMRRNFFKTIDMRTDIRGKGYAGVSGILLFFLGNLGATVHSVYYVDFNDKGIFAESNDKRCVKIHFSMPDTKGSQFLQYCSLDLSDSGIRKTKGAREMLLNIGKKVTMLKAASYLMYRKTFDDVRNLILDSSDAILTDSSGIPYKYLSNKKQWHTKLFGNYIRPIRLFRGRYQKDLRLAYKKQKKKNPLSFFYGYNLTANRSNLLFSVRAPENKLIYNTKFDGSETKGKIVGKK